MRPRTDRSRRRAQSRTRREKASSCVPPRAHPAPRDSDPPASGHPWSRGRSGAHGMGSATRPASAFGASAQCTLAPTHLSLSVASATSLGLMAPLRRAFCSSLYVWGRPRQSLSRLFPAIADDALSSREQFFCFSGCEVLPAVHTWPSVAVSMTTCVLNSRSLRV